MLDKYSVVEKTIFIFDRGISSKGNFNLIREKKAQFICGMPKNNNIKKLVSSMKEADFIKIDEDILYYETVKDSCVMLVTAELIFFAKRSFKKLLTASRILPSLTDSVTLFVMLLLLYRPIACQWAGSLFPGLFGDFIHKLCKLRTFAGANPTSPNAVFIQSQRFKDLLQHSNTASGFIVTGNIVAIARVTTTNHDAVSAGEERFNHVYRVDSAAAHHSDRVDIRWILRSGSTGEVRGGTSAPVA